MRCSRVLACAAAAVLALAAPQVAAQTICDKYSAALNVTNEQLMNTIIARVIFGVNNQSSAVGQPGTFAALQTSANTLDLVSTTNFGASSGSISIAGPTAQLVAVARRPNGGNFSFIDTDGQIWQGDVDSAIRNGAKTVTVEALGSANQARTNGISSTGSIGFDFNPVGDAIRITNGNRNFRVGGATGNSPGNAAGEDGTPTGNTFSYTTPPSGGATPLIVATAYTNQVSPSPRNATATFGTTQYGIDQATKQFVTITNSNNGVIGSSFPITVNSAPIGDFTAADLTIVPQANDGVSVPAGNVVLALINGVVYSIVPTTGVATPLSGALSSASYRSVAFTPARGNNGVIEPLNAVAGIAGSSNIVGFFNRGIIFKTNQPDWTAPGDAQNELVTKLVRFFGAPGALGCSNLERPAANAPSQYTVHRAMNITKAQFDTFNAQVANAALSFGVSQSEVDEVASVLNLFNRQTIGDNSNAICTTETCECAPNYSPAGDCQTFNGNSVSSSSSSTGDNGGNPGGAAAGLSAPFALVAALAVAVAALRA